MARIAIAKDVAQLIGDFAERVENRSLLLDRYAFHKSWPVEEDERGVVKWDDASRWSFVRISDGASSILNKNAAELEGLARKSGNEQKRAQAHIARQLATVNWDRADQSVLRSKHSQRLLTLFRESYGERCAVVVGKLEGRLAINLADSLIQNAGICLDRLFGLPYIPGSGVKGVCRHAGLEKLRQATGSDRESTFRRFRSVFGSADNDFGREGALKDFAGVLGSDSKDLRGAISFLPAYPVSEAKVVVDLTNVHYPDYYRTGQEGDQNREAPRPNPFPAVESGARFGFAMVLNGMDKDLALLDFARECLEEALTVRGLGAKTASGYGWFSIDHEYETAMVQAAEAETAAERDAALAAKEQAKREAEDAAKLAAMTPEQRAGETLLALTDAEFAERAKQLAERPEDEQRAFLNLLLTDKAKRDRWKTWKRKKQDLVASLREIGKQHGIDLP
jgi:CRISPR type III-B/RAMP module RAMP protein Cmr6